MGIYEVTLERRTSLLVSGQDEEAARAVALAVESAVDIWPMDVDPEVDEVRPVPPASVGEGDEVYRLDEFGNYMVDGADEITDEDAGPIPGQESFFASEA